MQMTQLRDCGENKSCLNQDRDYSPRCINRTWPASEEKIFASEIKDLCGQLQQLSTIWMHHCAISSHLSQRRMIKYCTLKEKKI